MENKATNLSIPDILTEIESVRRDARQDFEQLHAIQLNWKPDPDQWSIAQCLDHLMTTNSFYFPIVERIGSEGYRPSLWQRLPLLPGFFGRLMLKALDPSSPQKFTAPKGFQPSQSSIDRAIVENFDNHQQKLRGMIESCRDWELDRIIISSPVTGVITYSLLNAFRILALHERRHLKQAQRVLQHQGFPK